MKNPGKELKDLKTIEAEEILQIEILLMKRIKTLEITPLKWMLKPLKKRDVDFNISL